MSDLVQDDSGYFESAILDDDGIIDSVMSIYDNSELTTRNEFILVPENNHKVKRAQSTSSVHSRGSSQFWEDFTPLNEHELRKIEDTEQSFNTDLSSSNEVDMSIFHIDYSSFGTETIESTSHASDSGQVLHSRKRKQCDLSDSTIAQEVARRPELDNHGAITIKTDCSGSTDTQSYIVVAHSDLHQNYFDKYNFSWGVEWEIARLVSSEKIEYENIAVEMLKDLAGPSAVAAPLVEQRLCPRTGGSRRRRAYEEVFSKELTAQTPWAELDREEESLRRDPLSGLGGNNLHDNWHGGKISFVARLRQNDEAGKTSNMPPNYHLELDSPELSTSTRFMRRWGSRRFLRVRIPEAVIYQRNNGLLTYFKNDFVIHKRVFRPFYAKDHSVFMIEIDAVYRYGQILPDSSNGKVSYSDFLQWHNPMGLNDNQSLAKWCARMALGLSNSVPGIEVPNILRIKDIYSRSGEAANNSKQKPESKDVLTDGCGYCSFSVLLATKRKFGWDRVPSAIQFRMHGAKGLLLLDPDDNGANDSSFRVQLRDSQYKINYGPSPDRAHIILDVLRRSQFKRPARLSTEIIVNLAHNGVSEHVFETLMVDGLQGIAASLTQWTGRYAMQNLWAAVARINGSVIRSRMAREAAGSSRVLGFGARDTEEDDDAEDDDGLDLVQARSKAWWADEMSGCPSTIEETVLVLLDSGFEPQSCAILATKLKEVFKKALNSYIERYKILVPRSGEAWIVPDPYGVLAPGEIFLKTSESIEGSDGLTRDHLLGDVLITRHPCCVPSDVQKVRAVWKDQLLKFCDVIILSVQGERSLASMLGGGDYDGDTAHIIWEPSIVAAFHNADDKFADPPPGHDDAFKKETVTVKEFLQKHNEKNLTTAGISELQEYSLAALKDVSLVGQYSTWHDTAVYRFGYDDEESWRLAYMFCDVLDGSKTGKSVKPEVLKKDRRLYNGPPLDWKVSLISENNSNLPRHDEAPRRQGKLAKIKFIMDHLKDCGRVLYDRHMSQFEKFLATSRETFKKSHGITKQGLYVDPTLEAPWLEAMSRADQLASLGEGRMKEELEVIIRHVKDVREKHQELLGGGKARNGSQGTPRKNTSFTDKPIEQRQNILRDISLAFSHMPENCEFLVLSPEDVRRYRASYAYVLETGFQEKRSSDVFRISRFPFHVAMRELGIIKAQSLGSCKMVDSQFYSVFTVAGAIQSFRPADGPAYTYIP